MKSLIKKLFPEGIKKILRKVENFFLRLSYGFKKPILLIDRLGMRFVLYPHETAPIRWFIDRGSYAKEFGAIEKLVKPNDIIFDVGANVGIITTFFSRHAPKGKIFSFEPLPQTFEHLQTTIGINHLTNTIAYQCAISNTVGTTTFYHEPLHHESSSLGQISIGKNKKLSKKTEVPVNTIDTFCNAHSIDHINFLKVDVEGFEMNVLLGAEKMLSQHTIDTIQFEVSDAPLHSLDKNTKEIVSLLNKHSYSIYEYIENKGKFEGPLVKLSEVYNNYYASRLDLTHLS